VKSKLLNSEKVLFLFLMIYEVIFFTPILDRNIGNAIKIAVFLLLFASFFSCCKARFASALKISVLSVWIFIWFFLGIIYKFIGVSSCSWGKVFFDIFYWFLIILAINAIRTCSLKVKKMTLVASIAVVWINIVDNIRLLIRYPGASELMNFSWGTQYLPMNIGNSQFSMLAVLLALFVLMLFLTRKKYKVITLVIYITCIVYIMMAQRAISVLSVVIGTILLLLERVIRKYNSKARIILYLLIMVVCLIILQFLPSILFNIASSMTSARLSERIIEVASFIGFGSVINTTGVSSGASRIDLYMMSVNTFFSGIRNFLLGIGEFPADVPIANANGIGAHSELLDALAEYGLLAVICLARILSLAYKELYKKIDAGQVKNRLAAIIFGIFIFNSFINNTFTVPCFIIVFLLVPLYLDISKEEGNGRVQMGRY
jgi:hypothetical protein